MRNREILSFNTQIADDQIVRNQAMTNREMLIGQRKK